MTRLNKVAFLLVCGMGIFTTLAYGTVHQPVIALFYMLVGVLAIIWLADSFWSGTMQVSRNTIQIPLLLLGIYAFVQIIPFGNSVDESGLAGIPRTISIEPFATRVAALHIFALCVFFAASLALVNSAARLRRIVLAITMFGFVYAFFAILQSVLSPDKIYGIYHPQSAVPFGSFVNRHDFAAIIEMVIGLPLGLIFVEAVRSDKRLLYLVAIALMGSSLLLSGSRGGLVALVAEIFLVILLTARAQGRKNLILKLALSGSILLAAIGGAVFVGGDTSLTRFSETASSDDISSTRNHIWAVTLKIVSTNMPFGAGIGAYAQAYTQHDNLGGYERVEQAHNDYLQIMADAGIVGLLIGCFFLIRFFREGIRNSKVSNTFRRGVAVGAFAGCFAVLIHSLFDFVLHITAVSVVFLTLISILVAAGREYVDDTDEFDTSNKSGRRPASITSISERSRQN